MIPEIGIMIGLYVITRYCQFIKKGEVSIFSLIAMIFTILILADLLFRGVVK